MTNSIKHPAVGTQVITPLQRRKLRKAISREVYRIKIGLYLCHASLKISLFLLQFKRLLLKAKRLLFKLCGYPGSNSFELRNDHDRTSFYLRGHYRKR